jgi:hypothetical protein
MKRHDAVSIPVLSGNMRRGFVNQVSSLLTVLGLLRTERLGRRQVGRNELNVTEYHRPGGTRLLKVRVS